MKPEDFIRHYESALATQRWKVVSPLMHDQIVVIFSNGTIYKGKKEVRQAFERNFKLIEQEQYCMENIIWLQQQEEFAAYMFEFRWTGIIHNKHARGRGIGTSILIREEGKWLLLHEHLGNKS